MILKLSLLITFLFAINVAATNVQKNETLNVANEWRKGRQSACSSRCKPNWVKGLQKYYVDIIVAFSTFPDELSEQTDYLKSIFRKLLVKVIALSNSKSKIVSSGATSTLEVLKEVKVAERTAQGVINEFLRMLPIVMNAYRRIVNNLTETIGHELVCAVNNALSYAENAFRRYMEKFNADDGTGLKKEIDYEPVLKGVRKLTNTISLKGKVTLNKCQLDTSEVQDALVVLSLFLDHLSICNHGLSSCSEAVLLKQECQEPQEVIGL